MVHGGDHVRGSHGLAAVEAGVLVQLESPGLGVRGRGPFGGDVGAKRVVGLNQRQVAAVGMRQLNDREAEIGARIVGVRGVAVMGSKTERATLGGGGCRGLRPKAGRRTCREARRRGVTHKLTAGNPPKPCLFGKSAEQFRVRILFHSTSAVRILFASPEPKDRQKDDITTPASPLRQAHPNCSIRRETGS